MKTTKQQPVAPKVQRIETRLVSKDGKISVVASQKGASVPPAAAGKAVALISAAVKTFQSGKGNRDVVASLVKDIRALGITRPKGLRSYMKRTLGSVPALRTGPGKAPKPKSAPKKK